MYLESLQVWVVYYLLKHYNFHIPLPVQWKIAEHLPQVLFANNIDRFSILVSMYKNALMSFCCIRVPP